MWPMRMSLPLCWIGGLASMRLILASTSPLSPNQFTEARIRAVTRIRLEEPGRMSIPPEPVVMSRLTAPVTLKDRSKDPSSTAAAGSARKPTMIRAAPVCRICRDICDNFIAFSSLIVQGLHRLHLCRALRRIHPSRNRDDGKREHGGENGNGGNDGMGHEIGQRNGVERDAQAHSECQSQSPAGGGENGRLGKKLTQDIPPRGSNRLAHADFAGTFRD